MNASSAVASAVVLLSLAANPASAMMTSAKAVDTRAATPLVVNADFVQGHEFVAGVAARDAVARAEASNVMTQRYFDADLIVTLGALALASGAFVAVGLASGRRRAAQPALAPREGWRDEVMQALESDLAQYTTGLRHAA